MYNLKFEVSEEGIYTRYLQGISNLYVGDSSVIVKLNQINQTGLPEAQTGKNTLNKAYFWILM